MMRVTKRDLLVKMAGLLLALLVVAYPLSYGPLKAHTLAAAVRPRQPLTERIRAMDRMNAIERYYGPMTKVCDLSPMTVDWPETYFNFCLRAYPEVDRARRHRQ